MRKDEDLLPLFLMREKSMGKKSLWAAYIAVLPKKIPLPVSFDEDELSAIQVRGQRGGRERREEMNRTVYCVFCIVRHVLCTAQHTTSIPCIVQYTVYFVLCTMCAVSHLYPLFSIIVLSSILTSPNITLTSPFLPLCHRAHRFPL